MGNKAFITIPAAACFALCLVGCDETPVKYLICDGASENCRTVARFDNFDSCELHKKFFTANCDHVSEPGKILCVTGKEPIFPYTSYCTK